MSIAIRLFNFKGIPDRTYNLPINGVILFDGPNGAGKTTLFEALSFALYDGLGNSCYPWQSSSKNPTYVHVVFPNGLVVYRQRRPNLFRVIAGTTDLVGDTASAYIESVFGPSVGWLTSGYIKQLTVCHFLTMSAAEKLDFLQKMFLPDPGKYERLIEKVNLKVSLTNESYQTVHINRQVKEQMYMNMWNTTPMEIRSVAPWTPSDRSIFLEKWISSEHIDHQVFSIQQKITQAETVLSNNSRLKAELAKLRSQLAGYPSFDVESLQKELETTQSQLTLALGLEKRNQLLISKTHLEELMSKIPLKEESQFTLEEISHIEQLWTGPSDIASELQALDLAFQYLDISDRLSRYEQTRFKIGQLDEQLSKLASSFNPLNLESVEKDILTLRHQAGEYQKHQQALARCSELNQKIGQLEEAINQILPPRENELLDLVKELPKLTSQVGIAEKHALLSNQISALEKETAGYSPEMLTIIEEDILLGQGKLLTCPECQAPVCLQDGVLKSGSRRKSMPDLGELTVKRDRLKIQQKLYSELEYKREEQKKLVFSEADVKSFPEKIERRNQLMKRQTLQIEKDQIEKNRDDIQQWTHSNISDPKILLAQAEIRRIDLIRIKGEYDNYCRLKSARDELVKTQEPNKPVLPPSNKYTSRSKKDLSILQGQYQTIQTGRNRYPQIDSALERQKIKLSTERATLKRQIDQINSELENLPTLPSEVQVDVLQAKIKTLRDDIRQAEEIKGSRIRLEATIESLNKEILPNPEIEKFQIELQEVQTARFQLGAQDVLTQLSSLYMEHGQLLSQETQLQSRLTRLTKIRSTLFMAEYVILDSVLTRINTYLETILGELFTGPIRVRIRSLRKLKTQDRVKPEINIETEYHGVTLSNPSELSGGQYLRVSTALMLAFAKMSRYPFVILDEAMSAADVITREKMVELLNELFPDKPVYVVNHDTNEGFYTSTIKF